MSYPNEFRRTQPGDQADGLRRLFAARSVRFIPVVSNPFVTHGGVLIERLCSALESLDQFTLLVDASEKGGPPRENHGYDLSASIESLSDKVNYLAARGLPNRWVNGTGSTQAFLHAVLDAAPMSQAVVVHGSAMELARMFGRQGHAQTQAQGQGQGLSQPRPIVLCDDRTESMTHAYAALKVLAQRVDWMSHDLLMCAPGSSATAGLIAERLAHCADLFLGGVRRDMVQIDPAEPPTARPSTALLTLMEASLNAAAAFVLPDPVRQASLPVAQPPRLQPTV